MSWRAQSARVRQLLRPERSRYLLGLTALFVVNLCDALAPVFMAVAIDLTQAQLTQAPPKTPTLLSLLGLSSDDFSLHGAVLIYVSVLLSANLARYPMLMFTAVPSHRIGQRLRRALAEHLLTLDQAFYDRARSGDLMSLATSDINAIRMMLGPGVLVGTDTVFLFSLVLMVMFGMSWSLACVALIPLPLIALITNRLSHAEFDRFEASQQELATLTERVRESFAGVRILQGYAQEGYDRARFERASLKYYTRALALARVRALFDPTLDLMMGLSIALVFVAGGLAVLREQLSLGTFVAFIFLVNSLSGPMIGFGWAVSLWQRGRASLARLDEFLAQTPQVQDSPAALAHQGPGQLELRALTFRYPSAPPSTPPALQDISLRLEAGQTLGVLGPVGSGKSTLMRLLTRQYEPPPGAILLDGQDLRQLTLTSLRRQVVLAPQDTFLFSDTVARNICLGQPERQAEAPALAQQAQLHHELEALKDGYQTMLGERGVNLSGGQRQRLAIARALATQPRVLLLDDCLSAVDASTEEAILRNLRQVFQGRTGVIVTHRVRAVQRCDLILVLDQGRVIERGTHEQLMRLDGYYARAAREQSDEAADAPRPPTTFSTL